MPVPRPLTTAPVPAISGTGRCEISIRIGLALALLNLLSGLLSGTVLSAEEIEYHRDVRPILADKCFACHGPDQGNRQAGLRLDQSEGGYASLESDPSQVAIRPGHPQESQILIRMTASDPDLRMPPPSSNLSLTSRQIDIIRRWIEQGAVYQPHWAFLSPKKSSLPTLPDDHWSRNEVDRFVFRRMKEYGLHPNPPASREHLLRRVTFDLTGLPPTLDEIDAFLADDSPIAFERVVDRLLASPRSGERMAADWLDVARYSDSYGFQVDFGRFVWPWRDWVIRAFNRDLPYDQFVTEQLAGDLLPSATQEQILATTFCRLHPQEAEGGSIPEEYRVGYVADRLQTFSTAFMGMTFECCKCHDHKYDPFSQQEYYQLASFFDNIDEAGLYSYFTSAIPTPTLLLADPDTQRTLNEQSRRIAQKGLQLQQLADVRNEAFLKWLQDQPEIPGKLSGELVHLDFEEVKAPHRSVPGVVGEGIELTGDDELPLEVGNFHRYEPFSVSLWMKTPDVKERAVIFHRSRAWTDAGSRGYELLLDEGRLSAALIHFDPGNSLRIRTKTPLPVGEWQHVVLTYDGSSQAAGLTLCLNGQPAEVEIIRDALTKEITGGGGDHITIGARFRDRGFARGQLDEFRVFSRELTAIEVSQLYDGKSLNEAFAHRDTHSKEKQADNPLRRFYLRTVDGSYRQLQQELLDARRTNAEFIETIPEIMVMREMTAERQTYLLTRGEYNLHGAPVESGTPAVLSLFPDDLPRNRLGLARWLTAPDHPLTARVAVNRCWQMIFGVGLVRTTEDLGNQGELPSHPELLDWLARDFMEQGWSQKKLLKKLVMSAAYQQSAQISPQKLQLDPENRWLSRSTSERFTAEMLRDNALAVSGLLVENLGGPPAKPYEVEVAFKPMTRDTGSGLYRRSLYTYWNRTGPAPVMMALDAAKRDVCQVRRERTLSPLQPLVLLNGPQFVEAARLLAERSLRRHLENPDEALEEMFRLATSRRPSPEELTVLQDLYRQHVKDFTSHPDQAEQLLKIGETPRNAALPTPQLAAMAGVANLLLNYDECVFRR